MYSINFLSELFLLALRNGVVENGCKKENCQINGQTCITLWNWMDGFEYDGAQAEQTTDNVIYIIFYLPSK